MSESRLASSSYAEDERLTKCLTTMRQAAISLRQLVSDKTAELLQSMENEEDSKVLTSKLAELHQAFNFVNSLFKDLDCIPDGQAVL